MTIDPRPSLRLFGEDWLAHGYVTTGFPPMDTGPCIICGAPNSICTGTHPLGPYPVRVTITRTTGWNVLTN